MKFRDEERKRNLLVNDLKFLLSRNYSANNLILRESNRFPPNSEIANNLSDE